MASIPLRCNICPKIPKFSDVSHLLTHIASKAHLSHYFNTIFLSKADRNARKQLDIFEKWYVDYGLEDLLGKRIALKEKKKTKATQGRTTQAVAAPSPSLLGNFDNQDAAASSEGNPQSQVLAIQPRRGQLGYMSIGAKPLPAAGEHHAQVRAPSTLFVRSNLENNGCIREDSINHAPRRPLGLENIALHGQSNVVKEADFSKNSLDDLDSIEDDDGQSGTKLKGILWPGMDIFDAATNEMKRKRNQKKDGSILEQMKVSSLEVEPTEMVFSPKGSFRKQFVITGSAEEDSPYLPPRTPPRKLRPKRKAATQTRGAASPRKVTKKISKKKARELGKLSQQALAVLEDAQNVTSEVLDSQFTADEMEEFRLTVGNLPQEKDSSFTIFEDGGNEELEQSSHNLTATEFIPMYADGSLSESQETDHTTRSHCLSMLSSEFGLPPNFQFIPEEPIAAPGQKSQLPPPLRTTPSAFVPSDKENVEPHVSRQASARYWSNQIFPGKELQNHGYENNPIPQYIVQMHGQQNGMDMSNLHGFYNQAAAFNYGGMNAQMCAHNFWPEKMPLSADGFATGFARQNSGLNAGNFPRSTGCASRATLAHKNNLGNPQGTAGFGYHPFPFSTLPGLQERTLDMNSYSYPADNDDDGQLTLVDDNSEIMFPGV